MARKRPTRFFETMNKDEILALPIVDTSLTVSVGNRLASFLSHESGGVFRPEEATIDDLIRSPHNLSQIPASETVYGKRMFSEPVCQKIIRVLWQQYRIDYVKEHEKYRAQQIRVLPIKHALLTPCVRERLSGFLSFASCGKISSDDATIDDLMHSAFNINEMHAYYEGSRRKIFKPDVCEKIAKTLKDEYDIDYKSEREAFLAKHVGLDSFIYRIEMPNNMHFILLKRMGNYNATVRDLLNAPFDFRKMMGFGDDTIALILKFFKTEGVDFETSRRQ